MTSFRAAELDRVAMATFRLDAEPARQPNPRSGEAESSLSDRKSNLRRLTS